MTTRSRIQSSTILDPPFVFNISHDADYVCMAFGGCGPIGVDIMKVEVPEGETIMGFSAVIDPYVSILLL